RRWGEPGPRRRAGPADGRVSRSDGPAAGRAGFRDIVIDALSSVPAGRSWPPIATSAWRLLRLEGDGSRVDRSLAVDGLCAGLLGVLDVGDDLVRLHPSPHTDGEDDGGDDEAGQFAPPEREHTQAALAVIAEEAEHGQTADPQQHPPTGLELQRRDLAAVAE